MRLIHQAALRIAQGQSEIAAIVGAEARNSVVKAKRAGVTLPWTPYARDSQRPLRGEDILRPQAVRLGVDQPTTVYPFYEAAIAGRWGQTPRDEQAGSGELWARYEEVAATNPFAWFKGKVSAEAIVTPTIDNPMIAWPYTKLMVANPTVNQGAALIITSLARARKEGVADSRMIHIAGGACANEPRDYLDRDNFYESHAQTAVLRAAQTIAGRPFGALELYSCFPCVPKMALRALGLGAETEPTVTGGLTFFGAPLNSYMTHAACAMVRHLRRSGQLGLLYGQGEFVTKHHALVLSATPPQQPLASWPVSVQAEADSRRSAVPRFNPDASGVARLETFTILYNPDGMVKHGVVILQTREGDRTMARVPASDVATLDRLRDCDRTPIGVEGMLEIGLDGVLEWGALS